MPIRYFARRDSTSSISDYSDGGSDHSRSTAPTVCSDRPSLKHHNTAIPSFEAHTKWEESYYNCSDARCSVETYTSTLPSEEDLVEECRLYEEPEYLYETYTSSALPSTPQDFAHYFPSSRRMCIRHDDTVDGNMNLRVDTEVQATDGKRFDLTLFHLRMHDLKTRDFSLRRYCRDSGREICHTSRQYTKPASERKPGFSRSMSNALASLRSKSDTKTATTLSLRRQDSGYNSMSDDEDDVECGRHISRDTRGAGLSLPTNTTKLEFSNYAHVDVKRRGVQSSMRYELEYWGSTYSWKRVCKKNGNSKGVSYHLYNNETLIPMAHIVPTPMTPAEAHKEDQKGGWVPSCSMWISDDKVFTGSAGIADVIVATGLMALVDDCIKSRWHRKDRFEFPVPMSMLSAHKMNMEYVGPKRLIDEVFHRCSGNSPARHPI